jgi:hypothetical protein
MSDAPRLVCRSQDAVTPEQARDVRARALSYVFRTYFAKKAAEGRGGENDPKGANGDRVQGTLPR